MLNMEYNILSELTSYFKELFYIIIPRLLTSWPFTFLIISLILKKPIISLIDRLKTIKASGIEVTTEQIPITAEKLAGNEKINCQNNSEISSIDDNELQEFPENCYKKLLLEITTIIKNDIKNFPQNKKENILIKDLGIRTITLEFNRIYNIIYDSQLKLLNFLSINNIASIDIIKSFYEAAKNKYEEPYQNIPFENWFSFIQNSHLITLWENSSYCLTIRGGAFVEYINAMNYKQYKTL